jgi:PAS domain S-box-containing protein
MQSIDSARFTWRSEKGQDLSGDLHDAAVAASEPVPEKKENEPEQEEEEDSPAPPAATAEVAPVMDNPSANGSLSPALIDQMPAMLWAIDGQLRFTSCRGGALADLGLAPDGLVGMTLFEFFQTDDTAFTPIAATLSALRGDTVNYELDWGTRVYRVRVGPNRDRAGQISGTVSVVFDISDVRREEAVLLNEGEYLRKIAENMPDAVVLVDGEGRFLYASPSCAEELGYDFQALAGVNFLSLIEPEDMAIAQDAIGDVYRGDSYPFAVRMRRADGSWALMETMATAVTTAEGIRLLLVSMRDVSEEKRSGEYVHLNRRMAEFRHKAQETAENLRQLLVTIERGDISSSAESQLAQALTGVEPPALLVPQAPTLAEQPPPVNPSGIAGPGV